MRVENWASIMNQIDEIEELCLCGFNNRQQSTFSDEFVIERFDISD